MGAKLWLVVGGRGWWWRNYGWSWTVVGSGGKIMARRRWLWMVVGGHSLSLTFIVKVKIITAFLTLYVPREGEHFIFKEKWIQWAWLVDWYWSVIDHPQPSHLSSLSAKEMSSPPKNGVPVYLLNLFMWLFIRTKFHNISLLVAVYKRVGSIHDHSSK